MRGDRWTLKKDDGDGLMDFWGGGGDRLFLWGKGENWGGADGLGGVKMVGGVFWFGK